jgi:hypothetical protein
MPYSTMLPIVLTVPFLFDQLYAYFACLLDGPRVEEEEDEGVYSN